MFVTYEKPPINLIGPEQTKGTWRTWLELRFNVPRFIVSFWEQCDDGDSSGKSFFFSEIDEVVFVSSELMQKTDNFEIQVMLPKHASPKKTIEIAKVREIWKASSNSHDFILKLEDGTEIRTELDTQGLYDRPKGVILSL